MSERGQERQAGRARLVQALASLGLGRAARRLLGRQAAGALRDRLRWGRRPRGRPLPGAGRRLEGALGANVIGYLHTESGLGEAARATVRALQAAGMPVAAVPLESDPGQRRGDRSCLDLPAGNPYWCNLIHLNPEPMPEVLGRLGEHRYFPRYNIGYWFWELEHFPPEWQGAFGYLDEVWVGSRFVQACVARAAPVPVTRVPLAVEVGEIGQAPEEVAAVPSGHFRFLFIFDYYSYAERKHPLGLLQAFQEAFAPGEPAHLVLKATDSRRDPEYHRRLREAARPGQVTIIDRYLDRPALNALLAGADCYVSLHRSEGFGLTLAEAMYLGKPAIATAYSGNLDFMRPDNSYLVPYRLVEIDRDHGPYRQGWQWAEPDLAAAGGLMRQVYEQRAAAAAVAAAGARTVREQLSPAAVGKLIRARLEQVQRERGAG